MNISKTISLSLKSNATNQAFIKNANTLREENKIIDGIGINYTKEKILSIKYYFKIVEKVPNLNKNFKSFFFKDQSFYNSCSNLLLKRRQGNNLNRDVGLSGMAISFRHHIYNDSNSFALSALISSNKILRYSSSIDLSDRGIHQHKYYYVFNSFIKKALKTIFKLNIPDSNHAMEIYLTGEGVSRENLIKQDACATVYPLFKENIKKDLESNYKKLSSCDPWNIEKEICESVSSYNNRLIPITKGYQSKDLSRKIYFSGLSFNYSSFI